MQFVRQIEEILAKRKTAFGKDWRHSSSYPYHCKQPEDNLLPLIYLEDFQEDFLKGAGSELISKDEAPPQILRPDFLICAYCKHLWNFQKKTLHVKNWDF